VSLLYSSSKSWYKSY